MVRVAMANVKSKAWVDKSHHINYAVAIKAAAQQRLETRDGGFWECLS